MGMLLPTFMTTRNSSWVFRSLCSPIMSVLGAAIHCIACVHANGVRSRCWTVLEQYPTSSPHWCYPSDIVETEPNVSMKKHPPEYALCMGLMLNFCTVMTVPIYIVSLVIALTAGWNADRTGQKAWHLIGASICGTISFIICVTVKENSVR